MLPDTITYSLSTVPADSQYLIVCDSTYGVNGVIASAASLAVPGPQRYQWAHFRRLLLTVKNGNQDVTVAFQKCSNPALLTSSAFETDGSAPSSGSATLASSTTTTYNWLLPTSDFRVYILAGANNPDALVTTVLLTTDASAGV